MHFLKNGGLYPIPISDAKKSVANFIYSIEKFTCMLPFSKATLILPEVVIKSPIDVKIYW